MADYDVITIGAGYSGLMTSILLAKEGKKVLCLELNDHVGGLASNAEEFPGFIFSRGALYLMFCKLDWLFEILDLNKYNLEMMSPPCLGVVLGGHGRTPLKLFADPREQIQYISEAFGPDIAQQYIAFSNFFQPFAQAMDMALKNPPISIGQIIDSVPGIQAKDALTRIFYGTVKDIVDEFFPDKERAATIRGEIMTFGCDGLFGGPMTPGSALTIAYHFVTPDVGAGGSPYRLPKGHIGKFCETMAKSLSDKGGTIKLNTEVKKIIIKGNEAVGVKLANGDEITADTIISSLDTYNTFINLIGADNIDPFLTRQIKKINYTEHISTMYIALKGLPKFGKEFEYLNDGQWNYTVWLQDPDLLEVDWDHVKHGKVPKRMTASGYYIPSMMDPSLAPPGKHSMNLCALYTWPFDVPENKIEETKKIVAENWIDSYQEFMPNFRDVIEDYKLYAPPDYHRKYHVTGGTWTHGMIQINQMFDMRPVVGMSDYRTPFKNLYLCGTSNHPGPGMTGWSPWNCYNVIKEDWKKVKAKR